MAACCRCSCSGRRCGSEGFRYRFMLDVREPGLRRVLMLMGPGTIGLAATQVNLFVNTLLATSQGTGAVSWLSYRVPVDVPPDRAVRRLHRHGGAARGVPLRCGGRRSRHPANRGAGDGDDDGAQRARDARPRDAGRTDRPAAVRARTLHGRPTRRPRPPRCGSTPSGSSATRRRESCRRSSTRWGAAACRSSSACARSRSTSPRTSRSCA